MAEPGELNITVCWSSGPRVVVERVLYLAPGSTVAHALAAAGVPAGMHPAQADVTVGVWRRPARPQQLLRDGDRVEIYRPLTVDPKVARRERFARQGARSAGLFAKRRAGAKQGY